MTLSARLAAVVDTLPLAPGLRVLVPGGLLWIDGGDPLLSIPVRR